MNIIARLEFELTYNDFAVHRFNHYTTRIPTRRFSSKIIHRIGFNMFKNKTISSFTILVLLKAVYKLPTPYILCKHLCLRDIQHIIDNFKRINNTSHYKMTLCHILTWWEVSLVESQFNPTFNTGLPAVRTGWMLLIWIAWSRPLPTHLSRSRTDSKSNGSQLRQSHLHVGDDFINCTT